MKQKKALEPLAKFDVWEQIKEANGIATEVDEEIKRRENVSESEDQNVSAVDGKK